MPAEELVEMVAVSGFDFVLIDCEHGPADSDPSPAAHRGGPRLHGVEVLVRIGAHEPALALRVLDQGATGIVAPHVDDADTARRNSSTPCTTPRWAAAASPPTPGPAASVSSTPPTHQR